jgi:hypothetical protein
LFFWPTRISSWHHTSIGVPGASLARTSWPEDSTYRSGRSPDWLKIKNPTHDAVRREAEEDWGALNYHGPLAWLRN